MKFFRWTPSPHWRDWLLRIGGPSHMDLCEGPLFKQICVYAAPVLVSGILQLCFNAADMLVIGRFGSPESLGAVGTTGALCHFIVTVFMGVSVGTNVLAARYFGARDEKSMQRTVHTSIAFAALCGVLLIGIGLLVSGPILRLMQVPDSVYPRSVLYMGIICLGFPFSMLYNFGAAVLNAVGDTRHPLVYLVMAGVANVLLNLLFVIGFHWDVAGVAIATIVSQGISAALVLRNLARCEDSCRLHWRRLRIDWPTTLELVKIGVPAGFQGAFFSLSNMVIQGGVNTLGPLALAGNTAAGTIEGFVWVAGFSFNQAATSFIGQNLGGKRYDRIVRSHYLCLLCGFMVDTIIGSAIQLFGTSAMHFYTSDPEVVAWGMQRLRFMLVTYGICALMDISTGSLRGLGKSLQPAITTLAFTCVFRVLWVFFVFPLKRELWLVMLAMPISWVLAAIINMLNFHFAFMSVMRKSKDANEENAVYPKLRG